MASSTSSECNPPTDTPLIKLSGKFRLIDYVLENPYIGWNWSNLTTNSSITFKEIMDNQNLPWNLAEVSYNKTITWEDVKTHHELLDFSGLSNNPNITVDHMLEQQRTNIPPIKWGGWDMCAFSSNPNLKIQDILYNMHLRWNWGNIIGNKSITFYEISYYEISLDDHSGEILSCKKFNPELEELAKQKNYFRYDEEPNVQLEELLKITPIKEQYMELLKGHYYWHDTESRLTYSYTY